MSARRRFGRAAAALALAGWGVASPACFSDAELGNGQIVCPSITDFRTVSSMLERRCGSADCHGAVGRPFRIWGQAGVRRPEPQGSPNVSDFDEYVSGGEVSTTDAEIYDNYLATCALEPEQMAEVLAGEAEVDSLTLVRKPRLEEKHKGGRIWDGATKGDKCLVSWINGAVDREACRLELERP